MPPTMSYEVSHPWITFRLRLNNASHDFWILAGEAKSKCEHIANVPLQPAVQKQLHAVYLVKGVRATVAIEGNTLSEDQVHQRLEGTLTLPPSQEYLGTEIDNVIAAINQISHQVASGLPPITREVSSYSMSTTSAPVSGRRCSSVPGPWNRSFSSPARCRPKCAL